MMTDLSIYFTQWLMLMVVFSVAVISPGPDFVVAVRNSIVYSRRAGIFTAFGFGAGVLVHVTYTVCGLAAVIASSIFVFNIIKWIGAAYLIYIGVQALRPKGAGQIAVEKAIVTKEKAATMSDAAAFRAGFLTNVLNPKATLFFLAIFSQIISAATPLFWQMIYGLSCAMMVAIWFAVVAVVLTHEQIRVRFVKASKWIDRVCGCLMIALGVKVALATK